MKRLFDAAAVAKRLTAAQRYAVRRGGISDERLETITILADREMLFYREPTPGTTCYSMKLTEFGRSVQAVLQERQS